MGFFSRLFGFDRRKPVVPHVKEIEPGKMVLDKDVDLKWRLSQTAPQELQQQIIDACRSEPSVVWAAILDTMWDSSGKIMILVLLKLDQPEINLAFIADKLRAVFKQYPEFNDKFLISTDLQAEVPDDAKHYRRTDAIGTPEVFSTLPNDLVGFWKVVAGDYPLINEFASNQTLTQHIGGRSTDPRPVRIAQDNLVISVVQSDGSVSEIRMKFELSGDLLTLSGVDGTKQHFRRTTAR